MRLHRAGPGSDFRIGRVLLERSNAGSSGGDLREARRSFQEELELDPTNANAAYELAEMHRKAGELEPASKLFAQALKHYPAFEQAQVGLARTLIALGRPADALPHLQAALKGNPDNEVACYQLAQAYRRSGNAAEQEKALAEFNRVRSARSRRRPRCPRPSATSRRRRSTSSRRNERRHRRPGRERAAWCTGPVSCLAALTATYLVVAAAGAADTVTFTDVTKASGITFSHVWSADKKYILESMSGGVAVFDFDNDGLLDVYLVNSPTVASAGDPRSARSELWRNRGDGTFVDVTDKAGVGYPGWGMGAVAADFDNDGWNDLYVTCYGPNHLYRNNGDGTFADVTAKAGVGDPRWSTGAAFADYDGDGWLDLFVANYADVRLDALPEFGKGKFCEFHGIPVQCGPRGLPGSGDSLYRNRGDGTFEDVSEKAGVADRAGASAWASPGATSTATVVSTCSSPTMPARTSSIGTPAAARSRTSAWRAAPRSARTGRSRAPWASPSATTCIPAAGASSSPTSPTSTTPSTATAKAFQFSDASYASQTAKASIPLVGWGTHFLDYDNDGWLDLLVVNGHVYPQVERAGLDHEYAQRKLLYRNNRDGTFATTAAAGAALNEPSVSRGSAAGDLDNDGDVDVVINNLDGAPTMLRNDGGNRGNFLVVDLDTRAANRGAIGAIVTVRAAGFPARGTAQRRQLPVAQRSQAALRPGHPQTVDSIEVRWPDGRPAVRRGSGEPVRQDCRRGTCAATRRPRRRAKSVIASFEPHERSLRSHS